MTYRLTLGKTTHAFPDLKTLLAAASPLRSGDELAGLAGRDRARSASPRNMPSPICRSRRFLDEPLIPYESDEVTRLILDTPRPRAAFAPVAHLTVGGFRDWLLRYETDGARPGRARARGSRRRWWRPSARSCACRTSSSWPRNAASSPASATPSACPARCRCGCSPTTRPTTRAASRPPSWTACCTAAATRSSASIPRPTVPAPTMNSAGLIDRLITEYRHPHAVLRAGPRHHRTAS